MLHEPMKGHRKTILSAGAGRKKHISSPMIDREGLAVGGPRRPTETHTQQTQYQKRRENPIAACHGLCPFMDFSRIFIEAK